MGLVDFLERTRGRDKVYRFVQNLSRLIRFGLIKFSPISHQKTLDSLVIVEGNMSQMRKILRFGNPIREILNLIRCLQEEDLFSRIILLSKTTSFLSYLIADQLIWLMSTNLISSKKLGFVRKLIMYFAFWTTFLDLVFQIHELSRVNKCEIRLQNYIEKEEKKRGERGEEEELGRGDWKRKIEREKKKISSDRTLAKLKMVKDVVDLPPNIIGIMRGSVSPGIQGFCGVITSILGGYIAWPRSKS